jgi:hypothetical protein
MSPGTTVKNASQLGWTAAPCGLHGPARPLHMDAPLPWRGRARRPPGYPSPQNQVDRNAPGLRLIGGCIRTIRGEGASSRRPGPWGFLGWVICLTLQRASGTEHYHPQSGRFRARSQSPSSVAYRLRKLATPIALAPRGLPRLQAGVGRTSWPSNEYAMRIINIPARNAATIN